MQDLKDTTQEMFIMRIFIRRNSCKVVECNSSVEQVGLLHVTMVTIIGAIWMILMLGYQWEYQVDRSKKERKGGKQ